MIRPTMFTEALFVYFYKGKREGNPCDNAKQDRGSKSTSEKLTRKLVALCRADARKHKGLVHRADGCLPWSRLCALVGLKEEEDKALVMRAIDEQPEQRLAYKAEEELWIYCYQGLLDCYMEEHGGTVRRDLLYSKVEAVRVLYHSTFARVLGPIFEEGLKPAARDVHMWGAENRKRGRGGADSVVAVDAVGLGREMTIWVAGNGVHLVAGTIPPRFLSLILY